MNFNPKSVKLEQRFMDKLHQPLIQFSPSQVKNESLPWGSEKLWLKYKKNAVSATK